MHYSDFNLGRGDDDFKPSDIVDIEEEDTINNSQEEILQKFKNDIELISGSQVPKRNDAQKGLVTDDSDVV